jgi:diguanylate cyclase (GGDEF)-like protein
VSLGNFTAHRLKPELAVAAKLVMGAKDFACLCHDGKIILLNDAGVKLLGRVNLLGIANGEEEGQTAGRHFRSLIHASDRWTLNSWWCGSTDSAAPGLGSRSHCRVGSAQSGWHNLELTCASHWIGEQQYEIIFGRDTSARPSPVTETKAATEQTPRAALLNNAAVLRRERVKRKWAERNVRRLAYQDHLTGLINRAYFQLRLKNTLRHSDSFDRSVIMLVINIDDFNDINDRLGSGAGDLALREVGQRIRRCMRATDTVARLGGDEFAVLVSNSKAHDIIDGLANKIISAIAEPFNIDGAALNISCCIGATLYPTDAQNSDAMQKNAHVALSRAKQLGPGRYQVFDAALNEQVRLRRQLEDELSAAITNNQLAVHYQPQVDINTGEVLGVEALVRWQHPERGMIPPVMFVPIAETSGLILPMTEWVMREACAGLKRCLDIGIDIERVSVNLSANLLQNDDLIGMISRILKETGLPAKRLEVEITESMVMDDIEKSSKTLNSLYLLGLSLALDDFGTGYSSLTYLRQFPLSTLKIDRSFITEMSANAEDIAIVRAVIALAHSLHLRVVAEGVEEEEQLQILKQENCDQVQGYYYSRPLPLDGLISWCAARKIAQAEEKLLGGEIRSTG